MPESVFRDTAAFVALGNRDDTWHAKAVGVARALGGERARALTTDAVLTEVLNTFSGTAWRVMALRVVEAIDQSVALGAAEVVHVDQALWRRGWQLFLDRPDKDWSLTDCISFLVMQDRHLGRAFTADRHFEQAGFAVLM